MLCKYSRIFGIPRKGFHSYRLFNLAIGDILGTIIIGWIIAKWWKLSLWKTLVILFILGIIMHRIFCVRTTIDKLLFR